MTWLIKKVKSETNFDNDVLCIQLLLFTYFSCNIYESTGTAVYEVYRVCF